jgi:hypothetical protein
MMERVYPGILDSDVTIETLVMLIESGANAFVWSDGTRLTGIRIMDNGKVRIGGSFGPMRDTFRMREYSYEEFIALFDQEPNVKKRIRKVLRYQSTVSSYEEFLDYLVFIYIK